jgi:hypothetical protein
VVFLVEICNVEQKRKQALLMSNLSGICLTYRNKCPVDNGSAFYIPGAMQGVTCRKAFTFVIFQIYLLAPYLHIDIEHHVKA